MRTFKRFFYKHEKYVEITSHEGIYYTPDGKCFNMLKSAEEHIYKYGYEYFEKDNKIEERKKKLKTILQQ